MLLIKFPVKCKSNGMVTIGKRLKYLRERLGLTQLELSQKSNISQASIARIEANEQTNLKKETIERLANALEVPVSELLEDSSYVREERETYESVRMIPVIRLKELINLKGSLTGIKSNIYEPSFTQDPGAFFLLLDDRFKEATIINKNDLLLIEPGANIKDGDMALFFSEDKLIIGRVYYYPRACVFQPMSQDIKPIFYSSKKKLKSNKIYKISEIRRKIS